MRAGSCSRNVQLDDVVMQILEDLRAACELDAVRAQLIRLLLLRLLDDREIEVTASGVEGVLQYVVEGAALRRGERMMLTCYLRASPLPSLALAAPVLGCLAFLPMSPANRLRALPLARSPQE